MATTEIEVVSPERTVYTGEAEMIVCRTVDGEVAFLANHTPLIGALVPCVVRIVGENGEDQEVFAVAGGFVDVRDNKVILLADEALQAGDIDVAAAQSDLRDAEGKVAAADDDTAAEASDAQRWAEARLEVAGQPATRSES